MSDRDYADGDAATPPGDVEIVGAAAAVYFMAAARLAEASVFLRLAAFQFDASDDADEPDEFERLATATSVALEKAAAAHERGVDLMTRTEWGLSPGMAEHIASLRAAAQVLNLESVRFARGLSERGGDGDRETSEPPLGEYLRDRAEAFRDKAGLMAESARVLLDGAHRMVERRVEE